ncbi:lipid-A-disaccharide synthase N-terminal domain-containing protein [Candidatus Sumerlaeota bacterium]|nr:lipid-A-disaccharide synthase N-terminal domain-containing protein [Candidatus Sumerlaeota bacterium]
MVEIGTSINVWGFDINAWEMLGIIATFVFASRFLVQWIASERSKRSVVPTVFWWLSLIGAAGLLAYGIHFRRLAVVLGQSFGFVVYIRNLMLIKKDRRLNGAVNSDE